MKTEIENNERKCKRSSRGKEAKTLGVHPSGCESAEDMLKRGHQATCDHPSGCTRADTLKGAHPAEDTINEVLNRRLYPYQRKWIEDESRFKLGLWARQTGKDFTCAAEAVADCLRFPGSQWLIIACTERQAFQSLEKVKEWAEEFGCAVEGNLSQVRFSNGSRITTLPAKPASIRGYSANLILTEFAFHDDCEAVWRAAFPVVTRPGKDGRPKKVRIISTPHGKSNLFHRLCTGQTFSKHFIDIHDAVAQGLPLNAAELKAGLADPEAWAQEYLCQFIDDSSVLLPDDLLTGCQSPEASEQACPQKLSACTGPLFMGVACGLQRTVCWMLEQVQLTEEDLITLNLNPDLTVDLLNDASTGAGGAEAVTQDRISFPNPRSFVLSHLLQILPRARIGPILPAIHIPMMHRIIVHIIHRGPEMPFIPHKPLHRPAPHLAASSLFFTVPLKGQGAMHAAQVCQNLKNGSALDQCVIVIWQHTPGMDLRGPLCQNLQQLATKRFHPFAAISEELLVFKTSRCDMIASL